MRTPMRVAPALVAVLALVGAPAAAAQQPDTLRLTLEEAMGIATGANPTYLQAENQLGLNGPQARSVWMGQILPQLNFTLLSTGYNGRLRRIGTDNFGNPIPNPSASWFYDSSTRQGLSLSWNVDGPSFLNARSDLQQSQRGRRLALTAAETSLRSTVEQQFLAALQQRELLTVAEEIAEARRNDLASAERLFELARNSRVDVLNAEVQVDQQRIDVSQQRRAYEQAILQLGTTLGDRDLPTLELVDPEIPIFDPSTLDEEALIERALRESPQVLEAQSQVEGARIGAQSADAYKWPSLNISYQLTRYIATRNADGLFEVGYDPDELDHSFQIGLTVPFLNSYFQNRYSEVQADVQLDNQREALRQTQLDLVADVRSGLIDLRNQHETYVVAVRQEQVAIRATEAAREEYRLGARTFEQLQQAIEAEINARQTVINSRFQFLNALNTLETAVGGPVTPAGS